MKVKALEVFDDYKEKVTREIGDEFIVSKERYEEIKAKLPNVIEVIPDDEIKKKPKK